MASLVGMGVLGAIGIVWLARGLMFRQAVRKTRAIGNRRLFLIAPCMILIVVGMEIFRVPLRVRWECQPSRFLASA